MPISIWHLSMTKTNLYAIYLFSKTSTYLEKQQPILSSMWEIEKNSSNCMQTITMKEFYNVLNYILHLFLPTSWSNVTHSIRACLFFLIFFIFFCSPYLYLKKNIMCTYKYQIFIICLIWWLWSLRNKLAPLWCIDLFRYCIHNFFKGSTIKVLCLQFDLVVMLFDPKRLNYPETYMIKNCKFLLPFFLKNRVMPK